MQGIQPNSLSDEELLRHIYIMGNENLPKEWVETLCERFAKAIDDAESGYEEGFADGFADGVNHANEFPLDK
jgi:flagellar biosynthesis/type III secretory pathway protein FliH